MKNSIKNNNGGYHIAYLKRGSDVAYYYCETEYWIVEWWNGYVDLSKGTLEDLYFEFLLQFKIPLETLKTEFTDICEAKDWWGIKDNLPNIYIDFGQKLFLSRFYDQALEGRMIEGWTGRFDSFLEIIPKEYRYWIIDGVDYSKPLLSEI